MADCIEDLPLVYFPATVRVGGNYADFSGDLAGIVFKDGVSVRPIEFRKVMSFAAGFMVLEHEKSGLKLSPLNLNVTFRAANQSWNPWAGAVPEGCDRAVLSDDTELLRDPMARNDAPAGDVGVGGAVDAPVAPVVDAPQEAVVDDADVVEKPPEVTAFDAAVEYDRQGAQEALLVVLKKKGARVLRQVAEARGIKPARDGETVVEQLLDSQISMEDIEAI